MRKTTLASVTAANKVAWEASAHLHKFGDGWAKLVEAAGQPGFSVLDETITALLKKYHIEGRRAVQIGCNNARELISLASLGGIPALGIDQSPSFLQQGRELADAARLEPKLLEANIYDLPEDLGHFDMVLITIGVLSWMPDLAEFFRIVSGLMKEGAVLVIYETHPFLEMFDPHKECPHEPGFSYFLKEPHLLTQAITYDGEDHGSVETSYWFIHTLGDIVTACLQAGLQLHELTEYPHSIREPEYDIYAGRAAQVPMSYSLVASKCA
ncbi:class I SAM-dependent methyltransferase [Rhizobium sp. RM]|uniref:class I SAM-dependent methyltransferase n=1 Tax=Rhizobium sp. RM TaxID=2748079 RepID=UPI00110E7C0F|nr:class I SAM-dependent methyltransferase [Rhizobium sp. RM]NWJ23072.1 class I SAM-dependent methyltransferase [Rhizobium sp. RM]TMV12046.1 class I SAM-dependent methyltransferase [Rhizobium sp. Td3]